jgi:hypothetical protein
MTWIGSRRYFEHQQRRPLPALAIPLGHAVQVFTLTLFAADGGAAMRRSGEEGARRTRIAALEAMS